MKCAMHLKPPICTTCAKLEMETEVNLLGTALAIGLLSGAAVVRPPPAPTHLTTASLLRTTRI